ncbi:TlpA disulfide reductase family protein [Pedobacter miscanthi]|uniref:TlpA family protein disulfide reductase n=1 Tax=Pedobacter miscanthi TaxID=2259170 RepID=UPI002930AB95|nr:TlpA disulfide reductase family protein [Pedobacter miscanthi]
MNAALKYAILLVTLLFSTAVFAQNNNSTKSEDDLLTSFGKEGTFVLKGKAKNLKDKFFEFAMTSYLQNNDSYSVDFNKDGSFEKSFPIINSQQLYLYLNDDAITVTVAEGDTVLLNWDEKSFEKSFSLNAINADRAKTLKTEWGIYQNFRKPESELRDQLYKEGETLSAQAKFDLVNNMYSKKVKFILSKDGIHTNSSTAYLLSNNYFSYASWLRSAKLLDRFSLKVTEDSIFKLPMIEGQIDGKTSKFLLYSILDGSDNYKSCNERYLIDLPEYREFMFNYIRFASPINRYVEETQKNSPTNFSFKDYYMAKAAFRSTLVEDWFITKCITSGFDYYPFKDVEEVYNFYLPQAKTPYFKNALQEKYNLAKNLKPGLKAPDFSLPDDKGKTVSLGDFKGKVVYIDFWGVGCGPCIYDIENFETKLHGHYKDKEVVFINVCVDSGEKAWKNAIKEYKLTGVNLIAEGWTKNAACKTYGVNGIPHYVIINKDGTMANNNAPRMDELSGSMGNNELDAALKKN